MRKIADLLSQPVNGADISDEQIAGFARSLVNSGNGAMPTWQKQDREVWDRVENAVNDLTSSTSRSR